MIKILVAPKPVAPKKKQQAINSQASCVTALPVLLELKHRKEEKEAMEMEKYTKMLELAEKEGMKEKEGTRKEEK